jgi:dynein heavy chain
MLCFKIMVKKGLINQNEVDSLIKKEVALDPPHQADSLKFIPESIWPSVKGLEAVKTFENLVSNMENEALQWRKWYQEEKAETADLPKSFNNCSLFHRLLLLRSIRPDRLSGALTEFVSSNLGVEYIEAPAFDIFTTYKETSPITPIFFVLFPGVDPTPEVEAIGRQNGKLMSDGTFINISMGQGQEEIAARCLTDAGKTGKWIMLQNVHLMQTWMKSFERQLEIVVENDVHAEFRCFVSSEPPPPIFPLMEIIPESILQNSIKVANEAPSDLKSNLRRAFSKFPEEHFKRAENHKLSEFKALLFGLCMFHSLILGRKKFGSQGWSRNYNFNDGDLTICGDVLHNYLSNYDFVPYNDIRYIFGEIMYGGHITDHWDRRTNNTYLQVLVRPEILNQMQLTLAPGFKSPPVEKFDREAYRKYIEERLPVEIPQMFGLHPNAEIGYLTTKGETLFETIQMVSGGSGQAGGSEEDTVKMFINKFLETCPENFNLIDMEMRVTDKSPYVIVCLQECERMNKLLNKIKISLTELDMGLKGQLNITDAMEKLSSSLKLNKLDDGWAKVAYFSKKSLTVWFDDMIARCAQLDEWQSELVAPKVVWISGLFNPMSYLTAIMQVTSRGKGLALDYMTLETTVLNTKDTADIAAAAEDGAFINGFFLEGAGWEPGRGNEQGYLTDMVLKDLHPELPIMHVKSLPVAERKTLGFYECPIFITTMRGPTYVTTAWL